MAVDVNAVAQSFSLVGVAASDAVMTGGEALDLRLVSDLPIGDSMITEVISGPVDLNLLFRHVKLADVDATTPNGPWPHEAVAGQSVVPATGTTPDINVIVNEGISSAPGADEVEAWAATISGTIPLGFRQIENPVTIDYQWHFTDGEKPLAATEYAIVSGSPSLDALSVAFRPEIVPWTSATPDVNSLEATRKVYIQAEVRVRLATTGHDSGWVKVPPAPIPLGLKAIPVPQCAALCRNRHFGGDSILLVVPEDSDLESAGAVIGAFNGVSAVVSRVGQVASLASWAAGAGGLVSAVQELVARLPAVKNLGFKHANSHHDLGHYNFIPVDWEWDTDIEDRASSAIAITLDKQISFYQHDDYGGHRLTFDARPLLGSPNLGGVTVADLHTSQPAAVPTTAIDISGSPGGGWGDCISSYRWEVPAVEE